MFNYTARGLPGGMFSWDVWKDPLFLLAASGYGRAATALALLAYFCNVGWSSRVSLCSTSTNRSDNEGGQVWQRNVAFSPGRHAFLALSPGSLQQPSIPG